MSGHMECFYAETELLIRGGIKDSSKIIFLIFEISMKTYIVTPH